MSFETGNAQFSSAPKWLLGFFGVECVDRGDAVGAGEVRMATHGAARRAQHLATPTHRWGGRVIGFRSAQIDMIDTLHNNCRKDW